MSEGGLKDGVCELISEPRFLISRQISHVVKDSHKAVAGQSGDLLFIYSQTWLTSDALTN